MSLGPKHKESFGPKETDENRKESVDKKSESAAAAAPSGTLREAFGVLNESGDSADDGAESMGNVSESSSEGKERKGDGIFSSGAKGDDDDDAQKIIQRIIDSKPTKKQMLNDIHKHFKKEQKVLHKKMVKYAKQGDWYEYTGAMAKLRQIRDMFSNLAHATYDALKNAWLKVVHGIV
ncbi:MAG: hypothetical protein Q8P68_02745 [Candidatus Peregrinibacteria bacterium]|nr:hypothetical protein [Candidatus Peregrinibacteria bacterium]